MALAVLAGVDAAGGIIGKPAPKLTVGGVPVALEGAPVAGHGNGAHAGPIMPSGTPRCTVGGIPILLSGHIATCGHVAVGTASKLDVS